MINMMKDILQHLPYALVLLAVFTLLGTGMVYTFVVFRRNGKRYGKKEVDSMKI